MPELSYRFHPLFLHFPIAFWISGTVLDLALWATGPGVPGFDGFRLPHLLLWSGVVAALPTIASGLIDYTRLPRELQESRSLKRHVYAMGAAFTLFLAAALWRAKAGGFAAEPPAALLLLEVLGAAGLVVGGHAAGRVVFGELGRPPPRRPS